MGVLYSRTPSSVLLPAPVYLTVDGEPDKTLATTHVQNGQSTVDELRHAVRQHLGLSATAPVRLFEADDGAERRSATDSLVGRFYLVTVDGSALGAHPRSVYRRHRLLTASPPTYPFLGNVPHMVVGMRHGQILPAILNDAICTYGAADLRACYYSFESSERMLLVGDAGLAHAVTSDETTWEKLLELKGALATLREGLTPTGLFTNGSEMETWSVAHRILMPAFSQKNLRQFFPVLQQQIQGLGRRLAASVGTSIDVPDLMTRITLDSIAKCGFDYEFRMMDGDDVPAFVEAMVTGLGVTQQVLMADPWSMYRHRHRWMRTMAAQRQIMVDVVQDVLARRKSGGQRTHDILDMMLYSADPVTGVTLSNANIVDQLITFLIAGHETTSGLLSFVWYLLDRHPDEEAKVIAEVDAVLGRDPNVALDWKQLGQLRYVDCVLKETLRLYPTAPFFDKWALHDTQYGQYFLPKGTIASINLFSLHRDPSAWTEPDAFRPERFRTDPVPGSYFPFGSGQRACIGMAFAMIEAKMVLALTLQRFRLRLEPGYKFELVSLLTIKPKHLRMIVEKRDPNEDLSSQAPVFDAAALPTTTTSAPIHAAPPSIINQPSPPSSNAPIIPSPKAIVSSGNALRPLAIYYGSNMGACQEIAQRWASTAHQHGLGVTVADLDALARDLQAGTSGARHVLIVTSTYNGQPPDNAREFARRLTARTLPCVGVRYAVFGCGNSQWAGTFQKFPIEVDAALAQCGGVRVHERGLADANADWDDAIEQFERSIWTSFVPPARLSVTSATDTVAWTVDLVDDDVAVDVDYTGGNDLIPIEVIGNRELIQGDGLRSVRHLQLRLATAPGQHAGYRAGDHFGVLARNPDAVVAALAARLGLRLRQSVRIRARIGVGAATDLGLPVEQPVTVQHLLRDYLDLQAPLNRRAVARLASLTDCPPERRALEAAADQFRTSEIALHRDALGVVLDRYASLQPSLADVVDLVPLLKPRYYSISSAPLLDGASTVALTVARLSWTDGRGQVRDGLCSRYLAEATPGQRLKGWLRPAPASFHLPSDRRRPLLLIGPGTGVAPMRSFVRERLAEARAGGADDLGPILLVCGCRHQATDFLYGDEFAAYGAELGPARFTLLTAFSRDGPRKVYVQDVIRDHANRIADLIAAGAKIFVCGDAKAMAPAVRQAISDVVGPKNPNLVKDMIANGDYVEDIWASTVA